MAPGEQGLVPEEMLKVDNIAGMVDAALLALVNDMGMYNPDAAGKYHVKLRRKDIQEFVAYHVARELRKERWFGAGNVLYASCCQEDNWRRGAIDVPGGCSKYRIVDDSMNLDVHDLSYLSDRLLELLKKDAKDYHIICGETVDFFDFETILVEKFGMQLVYHGRRGDGIIVCDVNDQYTHDALFYDRQVLEVEMGLRKNNLF